METKQLVLGALLVVSLLILSPYVTPEAFYFRDETSYGGVDPTICLSAFQIVLLGGAGFLVYNKLK